MSRFGRILTGAIGGLGGAMTDTIAPLIKERGEEKKRKEKAKKIAGSLQGQFEGVEDDSSLGLIKKMLLESPEMLLNKAGELSPAFGFLFKGLQGQETAEADLLKEKRKRAQDLEDRDLDLEEFEKKETFKDKLSRDAKIRELEAEKAEGVLTHQRAIELEQLKEAGRLKRTQIRADARKKSGGGSRALKVSDAFKVLDSGIDPAQFARFQQNPTAFGVGDAGELFLKNSPQEPGFLQDLFSQPAFPFGGLTAPGFNGR
jgi:hypothetical protein